MATWHQSQNPVQLYHNTKHSVITDAPHGMTSRMLFETMAEAKEYLDKIIAKGETRSYILPPPRNYAAEVAALKARKLS